MSDIPGGGSGRLFVAVIPPPPVIAALASLHRPETPGLRWTRPEQWHVTLRFLGQASIAAATRALADVDAPSVQARVGPVVSRLGRSVVMVPVAGLDGLAAAVAGATAAVGEPPAERPFVGHITLARSRQRVPVAALGAELALRFEVSAVHLVQSHLSDAGARYELLSARDLG